MATILAISALAVASFAILFFTTSVLGQRTKFTTIAVGCFTFIVAFLALYLGIQQFPSGSMNTPENSIATNSPETPLPSQAPKRIGDIGYYEKPIEKSLDMTLEDKCTSDSNGTVICSTSNQLVQVLPPYCQKLTTRAECFNKQAAINKLKKIEYVYNSPHEMSLLESQPIALILNTTDDSEIESQLSSLAGDMKKGQTPYTLQMEAELVGPTFEITPLGRQRRELSILNPTRWDWLVTPKREGRNQLILFLYVIFTDNDGKNIGEDTPLAKYQIIEVTVSPATRFTNFVTKTEPLRASLFALFGGLGGLLGWLGISGLRNSKKKSTKPIAPEVIEVRLVDEAAPKKDRNRGRHDAKNPNDFGKK